MSSKRSPTGVLRKEKIMSKNKISTDAFISTFVKYAEGYTKLRMDNVVLPDLRSCSLLNMVLSQVVKTKEQPDGCAYDSEEFRVVLRMLDGKVLYSAKKDEEIKDKEKKVLPDAYCWKHSKVEGAKAVKNIGWYSISGRWNAKKFLKTLATQDDANMVCELLSFIHAPFLLVTTDEEDRRVIEVTQELYDADLTYVVDEWMRLDENGDANETQLNVGDFIVVSNNGYYCIRRDEFQVTHRKN